MEIVSINAPQGHSHPHALTVLSKNTEPSSSFIEGGTLALTLDELRHWQEAGVRDGNSPKAAAADFVSIVSESLQHIFRHEEISEPHIRVMPIQLDIVFGCPCMKFPAVTASVHPLTAWRFSLKCHRFVSKLEGTLCTWQWVEHGATTRAAFAALRLRGYNSLPALS
jgi:hypothetical protein